MRWPATLAAIAAKARVRRTHPPKVIAIGTITALMGTNIEIVSRCLSCDLAGHPVGPHAILSCASLAGWSSLWMLPIYGLIGVLLGKLNERVYFAQLRMIWQCLIAVVLILAIELATGCVLNKGLGLAIWSYDGKVMNLWGQICLAHGLMFCFGLTPFCFWVDAVIRWAVYGEPRPPALWTYFRFFARRDSTATQP